MAIGCPLRLRDMPGLLLRVMTATVLALVRRKISSIGGVLAGLRVHGRKAGGSIRGRGNRGAK